MKKKIFLFYFILSTTNQYILYTITCHVNFVKSYYYYKHWTSELNLKMNIIKKSWKMITRGFYREGGEGRLVLLISTRLEALLANKIMGLRVNMFLYSMGHAWWILDPIVWFNYGLLGRLDEYKPHQIIGSMLATSEGLRWTWSYGR